MHIRHIGILLEAGDWMKKHKAFLNEKGSMYMLIMIFMFVFIVSITFIIERNLIIIKADSIKRDLEQAARISINISMLDDYRKDEISRIDDVKGRKEFEKYLLEQLRLTPLNEKLNNNYLVYRVRIDELNIIQQPPAFEISGSMEINSIFFKEFNKLYEIPFELKVTNHRI